MKTVKKLQSQSRGFTLVELLIVIAIIGILSTLLMSNFIGVRQRARDGKRKADISQIQAALEQYRSDQGNYPAAGAGAGSFPSCGSTFQDVSQAIIYMQKVPCDPLVAVGYYNGGSYYYVLSGSNYTLTTCLENPNDSQGTKTAPSGNPSGCNTVNSDGSKGYYYTVTNP